MGRFHFSNACGRARRLREDGEDRLRLKGRSFRGFLSRQVPAEGCPCCTGPLGLPARLCSGGSAGPGGRPRAVGKLLGAEGSSSRSRLCRDPLRSARA